MCFFNRKVRIVKCCQSETNKNTVVVIIFIPCVIKLSHLIASLNMGHFLKSPTCSLNWLHTSTLSVRVQCIKVESSTCARLRVNRPSDTQDTVGLLLLIVERLLKQNGDWSRAHKASHQMHLVIFYWHLLKDTIENSAYNDCTLITLPVMDQRWVCLYVPSHQLSGSLVLQARGHSYQTVLLWTNQLINFLDMEPRPTDTNRRQLLNYSAFRKYLDPFTCPPILCYRCSKIFNSFSSRRSAKKYSRIIFFLKSSESEWT